MNEEEFIRTYYEDAGIPKEIISDVLKEVAGVTEIPLTKIRPTDRFDIELAPNRGWVFGDKIAEISWFVQSKMKQAGISEPVKLHTVDDLIRYIAKLETQKAITNDLTAEK